VREEKKKVFTVDMSRFLETLDKFETPRGAILSRMAESTVIQSYSATCRLVAAYIDGVVPPAAQEKEFFYLL
jgi:hypothetical protein